MPSVDDQRQVILYKKYRLTTPDFVILKIIDWIRRPDHPEVGLDTAVDLGCGTGQHTVALSPHFKRVLAFDVSEAQIAEARRHAAPSNVSYASAPADRLPLDDRSVQLVTGNLSFHWFDLERVYAEANRVLTEGGVLAATGYTAMPTVVHGIKGNELNQLIFDFEKQHLQGEGFQPSPRSLHYLNLYRCLPLPYQEQLRIENLSWVTSGSLEHLLGVLCARSSFQHPFKDNPLKMLKALEQLRQNILTELGFTEGTQPEEVLMELRYEYFLAMCRKPTTTDNTAKN